MTTEFGNNFLYMTPEAQAEKEKTIYIYIYKLGLMKNFKFCVSKDAINRVQKGNPRRSICK